MNLKNLENWRSWMLNIKHFIAFILLLNTFPVKAQDVISLDSIVQIIEKENLDLKFYDQKILSQDAKVAGAKSWMAPMIGAGTFMTPYPGQNTINGDKGALMFVAEQTLPNPAKIKSRQSYLASLSNITKNQKALTLNNIKALAKENYYDVIINDRKLKLLNENLHILSNLKKLAEIRYEYNKGTLSQIYKAESRIFETHNQLEDAEGNIKIAKINLNILMNRNPENPLYVNTNTEFKTSKILTIDSIYLLNNTSELKLAANEIKSMERESESIMNEAKPEFKIRFDHMAPLSGMMPQQYSAMAMVSIPIAPWSSKSYKADLKANKIEIQALEQRKNALLANNYGMIKSLQQKIANMEHHIEMFEDKIIPINKKNLDVLLLNYQENKEELPMVIEGWEMLKKVQLDHLNELSNYYKMVIEYEKSIEQ